MKAVLKQVLLVTGGVLVAVPAVAQNTEAQSKTQKPVPAWVQRGIPGAGHGALAPLIGTWPTATTSTTTSTTTIYKGGK